MPEVRLFKLDYDVVIKELKDYAKKSVKKGALAVILIGSLARDDYTAFSDADVVIIVRKSKERPLDRIAKYIEPKATITIEPRVYTVDEMRKMVKEKSGVIREIAEYGVLLGGDEKIYEKIRQFDVFLD
ncbi:MAG: nucleotidyltransferase domain-containing protein [Candidatus Bathyarchaeota archaeon]